MAADQALLSDIEERKQLYTFKYHDLPEDQSPIPKSTITSEPASIAPPPPPQQKSKPPPKRKQPSATEKGGKKPKVTAPKTSKKVVSQKIPKYTEVKASPSLSAEKPKSDHLADPFAFDEPGKVSLFSFNNTIIT